MRQKSVSTHTGIFLVFGSFAIKIQTPVGTENTSLLSKQTVAGDLVRTAENT